MYLQGKAVVELMDLRTGRWQIDLASRCLPMVQTDCDVVVMAAARTTSAEWIGPSEYCLRSPVERFGHRNPKTGPQTDRGDVALRVAST